MALNVQTAGDEAIYISWPGYTGTPTPTSGKTIPGLTGRKELRRIYFGDVTKTVNGVKVLDPAKATDDKVRWAHKWRLNLSGDNCSFAMSSNDPKFTQSGNVGRCKDAKTITVTVTPSSGYEFEKWSDGSTANPRTFTMTSHISYSVSCVANITISFYPYESATSPIKTVRVARGTKASDVLPTMAETGIIGWTFDGWYSRGATAASIYDALTSDASFYAYWYKEFNNIIARTSTLPGNNTSNPDVPNNKSYIWMVHLAWASELSLPAGATVSIAYLMSLLNHDGDATIHYLTIAPCMLTSGFEYDPRTTITSSNDGNTHATVPNNRINETWSSIYHGERSWNDKKQKWEYSNVKDEGVTLKIDTNASPTLKNDWGKYAPLQWYNQFHWYDDSALIDENTGAAIPVSDWTVLESKFVGRWSRPSDNNPNQYDPMKHSHLSSTLNTNKSVDHGLIQVDFDDYCIADRTAYPIPAAMEDGLAANELALFLSKQSSGCIVQWRMLIHQLKFDLR